MKKLHDAHRAGPGASRNDEARWQPGYVGNNTGDIRDCAGGLAADQLDADGGKRFSTLRARLALAGWVLTRNDAVSATFTASRWGRSTAVLGDLAAVDAFAGRVGAPS